jgi:hypothetical protein
MNFSRAHSKRVILSASDEDARRTSTQEFAGRNVCTPVTAADRGGRFPTVGYKLPAVSSAQPGKML